MYSKISEDTYRKLIDKLVRIPYVTGAHATRAIFGDGIEVAFQHRYMGKQVEYYLVADSQRDGRRSYRWRGGVYTVPSAHWIFDDGNALPWICRRISWNRWMLTDCMTRLCPI